MKPLERRLTRIDALAIALGAVIGVGVFRSTSTVLRGAGSFEGATLIWLGVGFVCLCGAVLYADLSARVPEAGGPYAYVRVAFGRPAGFIYGWMNAGISIPVRQASVFAVIGEVLARVVPWPARVLSVAVLLLLVALNLLGVRAGALTQRVLTASKLGTVVLVVVLALFLVPHAEAITAGTLLPTASLAAAVGAAWYTYLGWQDVVLLAEELHEPRRDLPVVLVGTVSLVLVLYTSIHIAVFFGLGGGAEAYADLPALEVATRALGATGTALLTSLMLVSMVGGAAEGMMVRPRVALALGRDGLGPEVLTRVSARGAPYGALLMHASLVLLLVSSGSFDELMPLLVFAQGFLGIFETGAYLVVLRKRPELPRSRFHPWAPVTFVLANVALCVLAAAQDPARAGLALLVLALIGGIYAVMMRRRREGP